MRKAQKQEVSNFIDSLENVYVWESVDTDCDAYCVLIPYYDLNPDHSFWERQ